MQKVTFINARGESIELYNSPFFLNSIEGLGDVDADVQSQKSPGQDGSTFISVVLEERHIPIEVAIVKDLQVNRQLISRVFNPKLGEGTLIYENDIVRRELKAIAEHVPKFPDDRPRLFQTATIDLVCHNPYWTSEDKATQLVIWEGGLEFPLQLPTFFSQLSTNNNKLIINSGDVETPVLISFEGPATSPIRIDNVTTGEFIQINQSLLAGERIEINTAFGQKRVTKILADGSQQNAFQFITIDSTLFNLVYGNNILSYLISGDYERAGVTVTWRERYLGI